MRIKVLSGGRKSIELPLSDAELNFQMKESVLKKSYLCAGWWKHQRRIILFVNSRGRP